MNTMMGIYTPDAWRAVFGGAPSLVIDDEGYIYTQEEYNKAFGRTRCGKIEYDRGEIFGGDYNSSFGRTPIGYIRNDGKIKKIYDRYPGFGVSPAFFIENEKIYTYDEYYKCFGREPSGYTEETSSKQSAFSQKSAGRSYSSTTVSSSGSSFDTIIGLIVFAIIVVVACVAKSRLPMVIGFASFTIPLIIFIRKVCKRRMKFSVSVWRVLGLLLISGGIFFAYAIFWILIEVLAKGIGINFDDIYHTYVEIGAFTVAVSSFLSMLLASSVDETEEKRTSKRKKKKKVDEKAIFQRLDGNNTVYRCPFCGAMLGVPTGSGEIIITCTRCGKKLDAKS